MRHFQPGASEIPVRSVVEPSHPNSKKGRRGARKQQRRPRPAFYRPALEALEVRTAPAVVAAGVPSWVEQGPGSVLGGLADTADNKDNTIGAVRALAAHPTNANVLYVGSPSGGIWKTVNATAASPHWDLMSDKLPSQAISALAFSPQDTNGNTLYAGTGTFDLFRTARIEPEEVTGQAIGILKTTNGGSSWTLLAPAEREKFRDQTVTEIVPLKNIASLPGQQVVLAVARGLSRGELFRSTDGGATWEKITGKAGSNLPFGSSIKDLQADNFFAQDVYAAVTGVGHGIYRSIDGGATWARIDSKLLGLADGSLVDQAIDFRLSMFERAVTPQPLYVAAIRAVGASGGSGRQLSGLFGTFDARFDDPSTMTWFSSALPSTTGTDNFDNNGNGVKDEAGEVIGVNAVNQADRGFAMQASLSDLFVGGDKDPFGFGRVFVQNQLNDQWTYLADANTANTEPGTFSTAMTLDVNLGLIEADSTGVYRLKDDAQGRRWESLNGDLRIAQVVSVSYDPLNNTFRAGTQNSGAVVGPISGNDGVSNDGDGQVDELDEKLNWSHALPNFRNFDSSLHGGGQLSVPDGTGFTDYVMGQEPFEFQRVTVSANGTAAAPVAVGLDGVRDPDQFTSVDTIALRLPYAVNTVDPAQMLFAGLTKLYRSEDRGAHFVATAHPFRKNALIISMVFGGKEPDPSNTSVLRDRADVAYFGGDDGRVAVAGHPGSKFVVKQVGSEILDLAVDPSDWQIAFALDVDGLFATANGGTSKWTQLSRPPSEAGHLRSLTLVKLADGRTALFVGTDHGVWRTTDPSATSTWTVFGVGLPDIPVTDVNYDTKDDLLVVGTYGRGVWSVGGVKAAGATEPVLDIDGTSGNDTIRLARRADNPALFDVFFNNATTPDKTFPLRAFRRADVSTGGGLDSFTVDFSQGALDFPGGIVFDGGSETDTLTLTDGARIFDGAGSGAVTTNGSKFTVTGEGKQTVVTVQSVQALSGDLGALPDAPVAEVSIGLETFAAYSSELNDQGLNDALPVLGTSLGSALDGVPASDADPLAAAAGATAAVDRPFRGLIRRLFESGTGGFSLSDLGANITQLQDLQTRLDALDSIPGNVTLTQNAGVTRFDVQIQKTLGGTGQLDTTLLGGLIDLTGAASLTADVKLHVIFGLDSSGFFIDADNNPDPEIVISNLHGTVSGAGRIGFLDVTLTNGTFAVDPDVRLVVDLQDSGTGAADDGLIRLADLATLSPDIVSIQLQGEGSDADNVPDVQLVGTFSVAAFNFPLLTDLRLAFKWTDINDLSTAALTAVPGSQGQRLLNFLNTNADQILAGINNLADLFQQGTGIDLLATKIPLLNKTLDEIINGQPQDFALPNTEVERIASVVTVGDYKAFDVFVKDTTNLLKKGVAVGQVVHYRSGSTVVEGTIARVDAGGFTVNFPATANQNPNATTSNPAFAFTRPGGLKGMLNSFQNGLDLQLPTLQDLVAELADRTGLDFLNNVTITGDLTDLTVEIPLTFDPDAFTYNNTLDFSSQIPGLSLDSSAALSVSVDPKFQIRLGVRLAPNLDLAQRFFIVNDSTPEITVAVHASLNSAVNSGANAGTIATGTLGILDVRLRETGSATTNKGIDFNGTFTLNLAGGGADNRITINEINLGLFQPAMDARLDIDGIQLEADVGTSTLGTITLSLDGESANGPGHITSLSQLPNLLAGFSADVDFSKFTDFNNLTPQMILALLDNVVTKLTELGAGGIFQKRLPIINKTIAELIDLGQAFAAKLNTAGGATEANVLTLKGLQNFLNSKLSAANLTLTLNAGEILIAFDFNPGFSKTFPFNFDFGTSGFAPDVSGQGEVTIAGGIKSRLTLAINTAPNVEFADRIAFVTNAPPANNNGNEIGVSATVSTGYDLNNDGDLADANEAQPLTFTASAGPFSVTVDKARALVQLSAGLDLLGGVNDGEVNDANRLTFREIVSDPLNTTFAGSFNGSAQAIFPLDGKASDGVSVPNDPAQLPGTANARITIAGSLNNLGNIVFNSAPVFHTATGPNASLTNDITDPLAPAELDPAGDLGKFRIFVTNLDGLVTNGLLSFDALNEGLQKLIEWGEEMLHVNILDFQIPLIGKTPRDALNFFSDTLGSVGELLDGFQHSTVSLTNTVGNVAMRGTASALADVLKGIQGIRPIGDANQDGRVDDALTGNVLQTSADLVRLVRAGGIGTRTVPANQYTIQNVAGSSDEFEVVHNNAAFDFTGQEVAVDDVVRYNNGTATGRVTRVDTATPNRVRIRKDNPGINPSATQNIDIDVRKITGAVFLVRFMPQVIKTFDLDLGVKFLDFHADLDVSFVANLDLTLGFGLTTQEGFFLKTDFSDIKIRDPLNPNGPLVNHPNDAEFKVNAEVNLSAPANSVGFRLGFLNFKVANPNNPAEGIDPVKNLLRVTFGVGLSNPNGSGKLKLSDLLNLGAITSYITPSLGVRAKLNIPLTVDVSANPDLPSISARFVMNWSKLNPDGSIILVNNDTVPFDVTQGVPKPKLQLTNVSLNVGQFITRLVQPILQKINENNPLGPVIEFMSEPLPLVNKSLFQLLVTENPLINADTKKAATFLFQVVSFVNEAVQNAATANSLVINFGSISLGEQPVPGTSSTGTSQQITGGSDTSVTLDPGSTESGTPSQSGGTTPDPDIPGSGLPLVGSFFKKLGDLGIFFPVLDFSNLGKLITGGNVDLVFVNLPELTLGKTFNISFPLFNFGIPFVADVNVSAFFGGGFELVVNLSAGLDTRGLRLRKEDPNGDKSFVPGTPHRLLDGFYLGDFDPRKNKDGSTDNNVIIDPDDKERPEIAFEAFVNAGIDAVVRLLGFPLGRATGTASISGQIGIDLNDDDEVPSTGQVVIGDTRTKEERHDGRVYLDELSLIKDVNGTPLALVDLVGKILAELKIRLFVALLFDKEFKFDWTLAEFEVTVSNALPPGGANLADLQTISGANKRLLLTSSTSDDIAFRRGRAGSNHPGGDNVQILLVDKNQNPDDGVPLVSIPNATATVAAVGTDRFSVTRAGSHFVDAGVAAGQRVTFLISGVERRGTITAVTDTSITVKPDLQPPTLPSASTMAFTVLSGRESLRVRKTGIVEDFGPLEKNANGTPTANFIANIANITEITDVFAGDNALYALDGFGAGDDVVAIDPLYQGTVRLDGGTGNDSLTGAKGNDTLLGNAGNDQLDGGSSPDGVSGNDVLLGGGGNDQLNGRGGNDRLVGDYDTTFEPLPSASESSPARREGNDSISGGDGDDTIWGDNKGSSLTADGPAPAIPPVNASAIVLPSFLPPSITQLFSFQITASDVILAGGGNDVVFAGAGNDRVEADDVEPAPGSVAGNDTVQGGDGNDTLLGLDGNDTLVGGKGADFLAGGLGDDQLFAGDTNRATAVPDVGTETIYGDTQNVNAAAGGHDLIDGTDAGRLVARGGAGNDTIVGSVGPDQLAGNAGNDAIVGGPDNDTLDGGLGDDDMVGGLGFIQRFSNFNSGQQTGTVVTIGYNFLPPGFNLNDRRTDGADTLLSGQGFDIVDPASGIINTDRSTSPHMAEPAKLSDTLDLSPLPNSVSINLDSQQIEQFNATDRLFTIHRFDSFVGTGFNDTVDVDLADTARVINGGGGNNNAISVDAKGSSVTISKTTIFASGFQPVNISNFKSVTLTNVAGQVLFSGDDLDNTLILKQVGNQLTYQFDNGPVLPVSLAGITSLGASLGKGKDTLVLDLSGGNFLAALPFAFLATDVSANAQPDHLRIIGDDTLSATYLPSTLFDNGSNAADLGLIKLGTQLISFIGKLDGVEMTHFLNLELRTQGSHDVLLGSQQTTAGKTFTRLAATSDNVNITPLLFANVINFTLNLAARDASDDTANDTVILGSSDFPGLADFRVNLGNGNDSLSSNSWGSNLTLDGGAGVDSLNLSLTGRKVTLLNSFDLGNTVTVIGASTSARITGSSLGLNGQTITVNNGSAADDLILESALTGTSALTKNGAGTLVLGGTGSNTYNGATTVSAGTLKLGATNRFPDTSVVTVAAGATLDFAGFSETTGALTSSGTVHLGATSVLTTKGTYTQTTGTTNLDGGTLSIASPGTQVSLRDGNFNGPGTVNGALVNSGSVRPGGNTNPGKLTINGNYTQTNSTAQFGQGGYQVRITSATPETGFDVLKVNGSATLGGKLDIDRSASFSPATGTSFAVLQYTSRTGDFEAKQDQVISTSPARFFNTSFSSTALSLVVQDGTPPSGTGGTTGAPEGGLLTFQVQVNNPENHPLHFSLEPGAPPAAQIDPDTGLLTWIPKDGPQIVPINVRFTDLVTGLSDTVLVECTVLAAPPVVTAGSDAVVVPGGTLSRRVEITDPAPDTVSATVDYGDGSGVQPLSVNADGSFQLQHTYALPGRYPVTIQAEDEDGVSSTASLNVQVTFNPLARTQQYVRNLYGSLLHRDADNEGLAYFLNLLDQGQTREQLVQAILNSVEYRASLIQEAYRTILGRDAEAEGLNYWLAFLGQGNTEQQMHALIYGSEEYFQKSGGTSEAFLSALYRDGLGRELDADGQVFFNLLLARGVSRADMAQMVLISTEAREQRVVDWYDEFLQRTADPAGLDYFFRFLTGGAETAAVASILGSAEFFQKT